MLWAGVVVVALSSLAYSYQTTYEKNKAIAEKAAHDAQKAATEKTPLRSA